MRKAIIILIVLISIVACKDGEYDVAIGELYHVTTTQGNGYLKVENASRRRWKGSYKISMRKGDNVADVIFTPGGNGTTRRFRGPIVPLAQANYNKRANPI